jgi:glutamate synthase domain-containing protein 1
MCGIAGFIDLRLQTPSEDLCAMAKRMADTLQHRGPDDGGGWAYAAAGIGLGHRRHGSTVSEIVACVVNRYLADTVTFLKTQDLLELNHRQRA